MRRLLLAAVLVFMGFGFAPVRAQDGFTADEQAALADIRAALEYFATANTYTTHTLQQVEQNISVSQETFTIKIDQQTKTEGLVTVEKNTANNQESHNVISVSQTVGGLGSDQTTDIGPFEFDMIVVGDRIYLRMDISDDEADFYPEGWQDVTNGADMFPGMNMYDLQAITSLTDIYTIEYVDKLIAAVQSVTLLEPDEQGRSRYAIELDARLVFEAAGNDTVAGMFNEDVTPFDVPAFVDLIATDEDTSFSLELVINPDGTLYDYTEHSVMDVDIPSSMLTDPSLAGVTMSLRQTRMVSMQITQFNEPVEITAPVLGE